VAPLVGAVLVRTSEEPVAGHRGDAGHAEYSLLKHCKPGELTGATLYTTLEPCTFRGVDDAGNPKVSCTDLILSTGVSHVVIGMLDPNPYILGNGVLALREQGVAVSFFPHVSMERVENANVEFRRTYGFAQLLTARSEIDFCGHWIAHTTFEGKSPVKEEVFIQRRVGNRLFGVMLNREAGIKYDFFMARISANVWDYSFRSKLREEQLDHGAGVLIFDSPTSARAAGVAHGVFAPSAEDPVRVIVAMRRASE
jgi:pyrimidine deaminase RibD-like protein